MSLKTTLITAAVVFGAVACSNAAEEDNAVRDDSGAIVEGAETGLLKLQVGDCWDDPESEQAINSVDTVACTQPHDNQLVGQFDLPDGDYPGLLDTPELSQTGCDEKFGSLLTEPENADLALFPVYPTEQSWGNGDREVLCSIYSGDLAKLTVDRLN